MKLRTKLGVLVATAVVGIVAVGGPWALDRATRWQATDGPIASAAAASTLGDVLRAAEREATTSVWYVASGEPSARTALATARPLADAGVRELALRRSALTGPGAADERLAIDRVVHEWDTIRRGRIEVDRRVIGDTATLTRFDRAIGALVDAFPAFARTGDAAVDADLDARAGDARLEATIAREQAAVTVTIARAATDPTTTDRVRASATEQSRLRASAIAATSDRVAHSIAAPLATLRAATRTVATDRADALLGKVPFLGVSVWLRASDAQLDALHAFGRALDTAAAEHAAAARSSARSALTRTLALIGAAVAGSVIIGVVVSRAIRRPVRATTAAATRVAARINAVPAGTADGADPRAVEPVAVRTRDEIGDVARAIHDIDQARVDHLLNGRRTLRNDIGDLYVNLARRNQPLLHRQLALIDELEANEHDPDRLTSLFQLDHLATRMRRNAESLLVLAGMDDLRAHPEPVPLLDLVRAAVSEIEDFGRVDIVGLPPDCEVVGRVAIDLTHVLAELIENAATNSPPTSRVFIGARRRPGAVELTISDEGIGIPVDRLDALNEQLIHPPLPGLDLSRSLGLVVVARLCERIGISVALRSAPEVGTSVVVTVPAGVLRTGDEQPATTGVDDPWVGRPTPAPGSQTVDAALPLTVDPPIVVDPPVVVDLDVIELDDIDDESDADLPHPVRFTPVPAGNDLLPEPNGANARGRESRNGHPVPESPPAPLPRRTPVRPDDRPIAPPDTPERRAPGAVFELVARYEAGRRRVESEAESDADAEVDS